ncbi:MAG: hypothetical protein WCK29_01795 [archaeon]
MAEKDQVAKEKVEHTGIFDFKGVYGFANGWFRDEGFDLEEEKYSEVVTGNKRNIKFDWKATKNMSDFFKHELKAKFEIKDLEDIEVEIDGKKKKTNRGKISVEVKGTLITDQSSKWDITPFYRFLRDAYSKYVIPARVGSNADKVVSDVIGFKEELKAFLELSGRRN